MAKWLGASVAGRKGDVAALGAVVAAAILMVLSGLIHIHLWDIAYRHVATLGPLFLVQAIAALVLAVVLVVARVVAVALACVVLMLGTILGFILADTVGIFGFKLPAVTGWAYEALITEAVSAVVLAVLVVRSWRTEAAGRSSAAGAPAQGIAGASRA
jgi:hypothetical protein